MSARPTFAKTIPFASGRGGSGSTGGSGGSARGSGGFKGVGSKGGKADGGPNYWLWFAVGFVIAAIAIGVWLGLRHHAASTRVYFTGNVVVTDSGATQLAHASTALDMGSGSQLFAIASAGKTYMVRITLPTAPGAVGTAVPSPVTGEARFLTREVSEADLVTAWAQGTQHVYSVTNGYYVTDIAVGTVPSAPATTPTQTSTTPTHTGTTPTHTSTPTPTHTAPVVPAQGTYGATLPASGSRPAIPMCSVAPNATTPTEVIFVGYHAPTTYLVRVSLPSLATPATGTAKAYTGRVSANNPAAVVSAWNRATRRLTYTAYAPTRIVSGVTCTSTAGDFSGYTPPSVSDTFSTHTAVQGPYGAQLGTGAAAQQMCSVLPNGPGTQPVLFVSYADGSTQITRATLDSAHTIVDGATRYVHGTPGIPANNPAAVVAAWNGAKSTEVPMAAGFAPSQITTGVACTGPAGAYGTPGAHAATPATHTAAPAGTPTGATPVQGPYGAKLGNEGGNIQCCSVLPNGLGTNEVIFVGYDSPYTKMVKVTLDPTTLAVPATGMARFVARSVPTNDPAAVVAAWNSATNTTGSGVLKVTVNYGHEYVLENIVHATCADSKGTHTAAVAPVVHHTTTGAAHHTTVPAGFNPAGFMSGAMATAPAFSDYDRRYQQVFSGKYPRVYAQATPQMSAAPLRY